MLPRSPSPRPGGLSVGDIIMRSRSSRAMPACASILFVISALSAGEASAPPPTESPIAGVVRGTVVIGSELISRKPRFRIYPDLHVQAQPTDDPSERTELQNVVIYVESGPTSSDVADPLPRRLVVQQVNETFVPHILPVLKGSTVEFPNEDPLFHNVFSLSRARSFDLGRYPRGSSKSVRFDRPGIVKVFCHIHSDMSAVVLVLDNPFFTVPDGEGAFQIGGIPPGDYSLVAWHERARPVIQAVRVESGRVSSIEVTLPLKEADRGD